MAGRMAREWGRGGGGRRRDEEGGGGGVVAGFWVAFGSWDIITKGEGTQTGTTALVLLFTLLALLPCTDPGNATPPDLGH